MGSKYDQERRRIQARIRDHETALTELHGALKTLDWLETQNQSTRTDSQKTSGHGGLREVLNPTVTWPEAIDQILESSSRGLIVSQIVSKLEEQGRRFGPNTRPDAQIRSTLHRCAERMGWKHTNDRPSKWSKKKKKDDDIALAPTGS